MKCELDGWIAANTSRRVVSTMKGVVNIRRDGEELRCAIVRKDAGSLLAFLTQASECVCNRRAGARLNHRFEGKGEVERLVRARLGSLVMRARLACETTQGL